MSDASQISVESTLADLQADGFAIMPDVLTRDQVTHLVERLWTASHESERRGNPTHIDGLDPNAENVRVFNLIDLDDVFAELVDHPVAHAIAGGMLGPDYIISNFTANIARPGSESMAIHSDQAIVAPEPWLSPWSINLIWCLADIYARNGATLYAPGSHRWTTSADVPTDVADQMIPFEAPAGSVVAMDGRLWHTSGANTTTDEDRPLLFGYYTKPFVRPQWNFSVSLRRDVQEQFSQDMRTRLGLDVGLNVAVPHRYRFSGLPPTPSTR